MATSICGVVPGVALTAAWVGWVMLGLAILIPNCLSIALIRYGHMAGTAASLVGFAYYVLAASATYGMVLLHNGTVARLPLFMFGLLSCMLGAAWGGKRRALALSAAVRA